MTRPTTSLIDALVLVGEMHAAGARSIKIVKVRGVYVVSWAPPSSPPSSGVT